MKQRSPAFQFYPRQFAADDHVMAMDLDAVGAHILLMCAAAASPEGYRIASDEHAMRNRLRNPSEKTWQRIKAQLLDGAWKLSADGKWWEQRGLRITFEKQKTFSDQQRKRINARWQDGGIGSVPDVYRTDTEPLPASIPNRYSSSSSSSSNIESASQSSAPPLPKDRFRGSRIPKDFSASEEHQSLARDLGVDINAELACFRDFWVAKPGHGGVKLDWDATFRNWLRKAKGFQSPRSNVVDQLPQDYVPASVRERQEQAISLKPNGGGSSV